MAKTIRELSEEFSVSKQAIRKKIDDNFRHKHVVTKRINGVQTILIDDSGYKLLKSMFLGSNNMVINDTNVTGNPVTEQALKDSHVMIDVLKKQLSEKDIQINQINTELEAKNKQIDTMQKLLDQSQQLQLMSEKKLKRARKLTLLKNKRLMSQAKNGGNSVKCQDYSIYNKKFC